MQESSSEAQAESAPARRRPRWFRRLSGAYGFLAHVVFFFFLLEVLTRAGLSVHRAFFVEGDAEAQVFSGTKWREDVHPIFENAIAPREDVSAGPEFAGWRIDPLDGHGEPDRRRVLFLGGSTTANDYPARVRTLLEPEVGPVTIYNLGASWHTSLHSLQKLWTYLDEIRPDAVVVLHNINDFYRGFTPPGLSLPEFRPDYSHHAAFMNWALEVRESEFDGRPVFSALEAVKGFQGKSDHRFGSLIRGIAGGSALVRELAERLLPRRGDAVDPRLEPGEIPPELYLRALASFRRNLRAIGETCRSRGIPLVLLTMPFTTESARPVFLHPGLHTKLFSNDGRTSITPDAFRDGMRKFNDVVRSLASDEGALLVDLVPVISDPAGFRDEVHLFGDARQARAECVARCILENRLLEK